MPSWRTPSAASDYEALCLSADQIESILKHLEPPQHAYYTAMWLTAFRKHTLEHLSWKDVDLESRTITISASQDKRRYARALPMPGRLVKLLESMNTVNRHRQHELISDSIFACY